jgi:hypothetical protein
MGLLLACSHIRTKRLFLRFADRHCHGWFRKLAVNQVDLGSGKRVVVKKGAFDRNI